MTNIVENPCEAFVTSDMRDKAIRIPVLVNGSKVREAFASRSLTLVWTWPAQSPFRPYTPKHQGPACSQDKRTLSLALSYVIMREGNVRSNEPMCLSDPNQNDVQKTLNIVWRYQMLFLQKSATATAWAVLSSSEGHPTIRELQ